jgi:hypothetical protein
MKSWTSTDKSLCSRQVQLPGHPMAAAVLRDIIKSTEYVQANAVSSCTVLILLSLQE